MKAMVYDRYGSPEVVRLQEVDKPTAQDDEVLVRVRAASVNPRDWHYMTGTPYFMRLSAGLRAPKQRVLGVDMAGVVEAVGSAVTRFRPGDEVFGARSGSFAEYVCVREAGMLLHKPANLTFEEAAAVPIAALTALQGLRDKGGIRAGQRVLINGAGGGVGTYAVQLAKYFGAHVTGVCSTRNVELVRSLGADRVIDYTRDDFSLGGQRYDLILDNVGTRSITARRRALGPNGTLVSVSGPKKNKLLGPLTDMVKVLVVAKVRRANLTGVMTQLVQEDLVTLAELLETGKIVSVVDRTYPLHQVPQALGYVGEGHARGKVVVVLGGDTA